MRKRQNPQTQTLNPKLKPQTPNSNPKLKPQTPNLKGRERSKRGLRHVERSEQQREHGTVHYATERCCRREQSCSRTGDVESDVEGRVPG